MTDFIKKVKPIKPKPPMIIIPKDKNATVKNINLVTFNFECVQ